MAQLPPWLSLLLLWPTSEPPQSFADPDLTQYQIPSVIPGWIQLTQTFPTPRTALGLLNPILHTEVRQNLPLARHPCPSCCSSSGMDLGPSCPSAPGTAWGSTDPIPPSFSLFQDNNSTCPPSRTPSGITRDGSALWLKILRGKSRHASAPSGEEGLAPSRSGVA